MVELMFMVSLGEWLKVWLGPSAQPIWLQFDVVHWFLHYVLHPCLVHLGRFIFHKLHLLFILYLCRFLHMLIYNLI
jgi:hypothetical protein